MKDNVLDWLEKHDDVNVVFEFKKLSSESPFKSIVIQMERNQNLSGFKTRVILPEYAYKKSILKDFVICELENMYEYLNDMKQIDKVIRKQI